MLPPALRRVRECLKHPHVSPNLLSRAGGAGLGKTSTQAVMLAWVRQAAWTDLPSVGVGGAAFHNGEVTELPLMVLLCTRVRTASRESIILHPAPLIRKKPGRKHLPSGAVWQGPGVSLGTREGQSAKPPLSWEKIPCSHGCSLPGRIFGRQS